MNRTSGTDYPVKKPKERNHLDYLCPWNTLGSKICPMGLCRFWSQELKDCRWNLWLESQLSLQLKMDENFLRKEVKAWKKNLKKKT